MKLTKYIMACILAFSLAGCIDDEPSNTYYLRRRLYHRTAVYR